MSQTFSLIPVLYLLGAAHGVFLAIALFNHHAGSRKANFYLGLYTLVFVAALSDYFIDLSGLSRSLIILRVILWPKEFLYGVLLYFYTRELTAPGKYDLQGKQWWHFAPSFVHILVTWALLMMPQTAQHAILYDGQLTGRLQQIWAFLLDDVELLLTVAHLSIYLVLCLKLLHQHRQRLLQTYSFQERVSLNWLTYLISGTLVVYLVWLAEQFTDQGQALDSWIDFALGLSMVVLIYSMSILGLRQTRIFATAKQKEKAQQSKQQQTDEASLAQIDTVEEIDREHKQKYRNSALSEELGQELMVTVDQAMQTERLYKDPALSLPQLAETLNLPVNYLSQVINQQKQQNFFDYINAYRVHEVTRLMQESPSRRVLDLALEAGFNSKSPFYTAFRKHTGMTPSQFRKSLD